MTAAAVAYVAAPAAAAGTPAVLQSTQACRQPLWPAVAPRGSAGVAATVAARRCGSSSAWTPVPVGGRRRSRPATARAPPCRHGVRPAPPSASASASASASDGGGSDGGDGAAGATPPPSPRLRRYIPTAVGRALAATSIATRFHGSPTAYATAAAGAVVDAIGATYTAAGGEAAGQGGGGGPPAVLVAFGTGLTGAVGVAAAAGLAAAGYPVTLLRVGDEDGRPPWRVEMEAAAEAGGVDMIDFVPGGAAYYYDLLVDAVVGVDPLVDGPVDGGDGGAALTDAAGTPAADAASTLDAAAGGHLPDGSSAVLAALSSSPVPVVCIDHPLGWALDKGPPEIAVRRGTFVKPDLLVSVGVPLRSARFFGGRYHYVGGGVVPPGWGAAAGVATREAPPRGVRAVLFGGQPGPRGAPAGGGGAGVGLAGGVVQTGDVYGAGLGGGEGDQGWMGTLFVKDGRREWVHVEDNEDLWDELD